MEMITKGELKYQIVQHEKTIKMLSNSLKEIAITLETVSGRSFPHGVTTDELTRIYKLAKRYGLR